MIKIFSEQELVALGISLSDIQNGSVINYEGKEFTHKVKIPIKFKEQSIKRYSEIQEQGKQSFISENCTSFSIWEEKYITPQLKFAENQNETEISESPKPETIEDDSSSTSELTLQKTQIVGKYRGIPIVVKDNSSSIFKSIVSNKKKEKIVRKYRGVIIED
jgi:hypothetical protein